MCVNKVLGTESLMKFWMPLSLFNQSFRVQVFSDVSDLVSSMYKFLQTPEKCFTVVMVIHKHLTQNDCGVSICGVTWNLAGHCPGSPPVAVSACAGGWTKGSPESLLWSGAEGRGLGVDGIRCVQSVRVCVLGHANTNRLWILSVKPHLVWQNWCISVSKVQNVNLLWDLECHVAFACRKPLLS